MVRVGAAAVMVALGALAACSEPVAEPAAGPSRAAASSQAQSRPAEPASSPAERPDERVVVSHVTAPALRLTSAQAERIVSGAARWRGMTVARGPRAIARIHADPRTIAVVPLDRVGPTVSVATVDGRDPVRDAPEATTLTVVGDLMLVRGVRDAAAALAPMGRRLRAADVTVGNLESTLSTNGSPTQGGDSFGGTPALLGPLLRAGFDAVSLANNHAGDYGPTALLETVEALRKSPIQPFGAGRNGRAAGRPAYVRADGTTFAFVGFNAIGETPRATPASPGALSVRMPPRTGPLDTRDLEHVTRVVRRAAGRADVVVVLPHWGTQYTHTPEPVQRLVARTLVEAGADLVVGGHPHWVQGAEVIGGVPVVHSLGNYVFDMDFMEQTMEGVVLEATFWGPTLRALRFVPYRLDPTTFAPRPDPGGEALRDLFASSTGPFRAGD